MPMKATNCKYKEYDKRRKEKLIIGTYDETIMAEIITELMALKDTSEQQIGSNVAQRVYMYTCIHADMAAINFSLTNFKDFTIFMPIFSHTFILVLLVHVLDFREYFILFIVVF